MDLFMYFDASFNYVYKNAAIAVIIKDIEGKIIYASSKIVKCYSSTEAELRALNKLLGYIIDRQTKGLLQKPCTINIFGDCKSLIKCVKKGQCIKNIQRDIMIGCIIKYKRLKVDNNLIIEWIRRENNYEVHNKAKILKKWESKKIFCDEKLN